MHFTKCNPKAKELEAHQCAFAFHFTIGFLVSGDLEVSGKHLFRGDPILVYFVWVQGVLASKKELIYILNIFTSKEA